MVFVDGTDAGLELIKEGFAWAYAKYWRKLRWKLNRAIQRPKPQLELRESVFGLTLIHSHLGSIVR
jgi:endonuclease YncB( thermonuclease family)